MANIPLVMLWLVPSICNVSIAATWIDPRHKAEDDGVLEG
jgi:hypothetical protein